MLEASKGVFYGTTGRGGSSDRGTIFKVTPEGKFTTVYSFNGIDGQCPNGGLVLGNDGNFYGATAGDDRASMGTIFELSPDGRLTTLFAFAGPNGKQPCGRLEQGADGTFYGTTLAGGAYDMGTAFSFSATGTMRTIISFGGTNGCRPSSGVIAGGPDSFYGVTEYGGEGFKGPLTGNGTVFRIINQGQINTFVTSNLTNGSRPHAALTLGSDGNFYGTAAYGGAHGQGTIFRLTPLGEMSTFLDFGPTGGVAPMGGLVQAGDGCFYGTTAYRCTGPTMTNGTIFKVTTNGVLTTLANLSGTEAIHPFTDLILARDGNLYGAICDAEGNHYMNGGSIFRLVQWPAVAGVAHSVSTTASFANGVFRVEGVASHKNLP